MAKIQSNCQRNPMKQLTLTIALCLVGIAANNQSIAAITFFSMHDKPVNTPYYDVTRDFSVANNPNGVWQYGWSEGMTGSLVLYSRSSIPAINNDMEDGWDDPNNSSGFTPSVALNTGGDFNDGNVTFSSGALIMHPCGIDGQAYCHVIWTAPQNGDYFLNSSFFAQQNNINVDVHILVKGSSVFDSTITQNSTIRPFTGTFMLHTGDTIDFTVGPDGNFIQHPGNTGIQAIILPLSSSKH